MFKKVINFFIQDILYKYDGFVYPEPGKFSKVLSHDYTMDDRRTFFRNFFPRWRGFYVSQYDPNIQPVEALLKLECLVQNMSSFWTSASGHQRCHKVDLRKLKLSEVCMANF